MSLFNGIKVFIGPSSFGEGDPAPLRCLKDAGFEIIENIHKRRLTKEELLKFLTQDIAGLVAGLETIDREVLEKTNLKVVSRCGAGVSNVDLEAAKELGIKVCSTPFGPTTAVAELTVAALLNLLRSLQIMNNDLHHGKWTKITGHQLEGKTVAIIGFGRIGRKVAALLAPFGVKIIAVDTNAHDKILTSVQLMESIHPEDGGRDTEYRNVSSFLQKSVDGVRFSSLNDAISQSDIISIHVSGEDEIIGSNEFKLMKDGTFLLNAARGGVVNEDSLIQALESGRIKGAWLDVFAEEPYSGRLRQYPQVLLTPHVGSYTVEGRAKMEMETVSNLIFAFKEILSINKKL